MTHKNQLLYGDNLEILLNDKLDPRQAPLVPDESVDLIYIDPPFNSNRDYNIIYPDAKAQSKAFIDTWSTISIEATEKMLGIYQGNSFNETLEDPRFVHYFTVPFINTLKAMQSLLKFSDPALYAYLINMGLRIFVMHKKLKWHGSFYLHCDATASHYLKIVCDSIFDKQNFRNEIVWRRKRGTAGGKSMPRSHDVILYYSKSHVFFYKILYTDYDMSYIDKQYRHEDEKGRYRIHDLVASPALGGSSPRYEFKGFVPKTRWLVSLETLLEFEKNDMIVWSKTGVPRRKIYYDETKGVPLSSVWTDINVKAGHENLGYPTQKPQMLLERILNSSCPKAGDELEYKDEKGRMQKITFSQNGTVLDAYCGCGTTVMAAQSLGLRWIGIDITHFSTDLVEKRILETYYINKQELDALKLTQGVKDADEEFVKKSNLEYFKLVKKARQKMFESIELIGSPKDFESAKRLALNTDNDFVRKEFEKWAVSKIGLGAYIEKKGKDGGVDGMFDIAEFDNNKIIKTQCYYQVKSDAKKIGDSDIKKFYASLQYFGAPVGIFISLNGYSSEAINYANSLGKYKLKGLNYSIPVMSLLSVEEYFVDDLETHQKIFFVHNPFKSSLLHKGKVENEELEF